MPRQRLCDSHAGSIVPGRPFELILSLPSLQNGLHWHGAWHLLDCTTQSLGLVNNSTHIRHCESKSQAPIWAALRLHLVEFVIVIELRVVVRFEHALDVVRIDQYEDAAL